MLSKLKSFLLMLFTGGATLLLSACYGPMMPSPVILPENPDQTNSLKSYKINRSSSQPSGSLSLSLRNYDKSDSSGLVRNGNGWNLEIENNSRE